MRSRAFSVVCFLMLFVGVLSSFAADLKGVYSGSGGLSQDVHRVVMIEFGEDGSALIQQSWVGKDPQTWHGQWTKDGKQVKVVFDKSPEGSAQKPLLMEMKRSILTPTAWDTATLGVLGPPKLAPFGGKNIKQHSVATCQALNTADPSGHCTTWDSRNKR